MRGKHEDAERAGPPRRVGSGSHLPQHTYTLATPPPHHTLTPHSQGSASKRALLRSVTYPFRREAPGTRPQGALKHSPSATPLLPQHRPPWLARQGLLAPLQEGQTPAHAGQNERVARDPACSALADTDSCQAQPLLLLAHTRAGGDEGRCSPFLDLRTCCHFPTTATNQSFLSF